VLGVTLGTVAQTADIAGVARITVLPATVIAPMEIVRDHCKIRARGIAHRITYRLVIKNHND